MIVVFIYTNLITKEIIVTFNPNKHFFNKFYIWIYIEKYKRSSLENTVTQECKYVKKIFLFKSHFIMVLAVYPYILLYPVSTLASVYSSYECDVLADSYTFILVLVCKLFLIVLNFIFQICDSEII